MRFSSRWLHQEWLSPVQTPPYRCIPMQEDRGEQQKPFARGNAGQPLRGGPGHVVAVEVVDLVVADHFAVHLVIKAGVVFRRIGQIEPADGLAKLIDVPSSWGTGG